MAKTKKKEDEQPKQLEIIEAAIKDDFCHYGYIILEGVGRDDKVSVKGTGIVEDDMKAAFGSLNVHLACIDDVFKHSDIEIDNINKFKGHELALLYNVTGFKIKGSKENESVILIGSKFVSCSGRIEIETPRIPLDSTSSYTWAKELKKAIDRCRTEVEEYKGGKYIQVQDDPEAGEVKPQIDFSVNVNKESETEFEKAKI